MIDPNILLIPILGILGIIYFGSKALVYVNERRYRRFGQSRIKSEYENVVELDFNDH